eukprot:4194663-Prymnesium_polylepis.2
MVDTPCKQFCLRPASTSASRPCCMSATASHDVPVRETAGGHETEVKPTPSPISRLWCTHTRGAKGEREP